MISELIHPYAQISGPYTWQKAYQPDGIGSYDLNVFQVHCSAVKVWLGDVEPPLERLPAMLGLASRPCVL